MENIKIIENMERKFLEISKLKCNLSKFPLNEEDCSQIKNNKEKSKQHGEIFTPFWLVDEMILESTEDLKKAKSTLDLCAGYGQFTIRMLRFLINEDKDFDPLNWLKNVHSFSEYQQLSINNIIRIFGKNINLFIGDVKYLGKLKDSDRGIFIYKKNKWTKIS